jgi:exodeoxyribonuclease V
MRWAPEQDNALGSVAQWLKNPDQQVFRLFGYAGTGKTTLARHLAAGVSGPVYFGAYTGKAAHVLRTKGCAGASTIHSLIYQSRDKGAAKLRELEAQLMELIHELRAEGPPDLNVDDHRRVKDMRAMIRIEKENVKRPFFSLNMESVVKDAALVVIDECSMVDDEMGRDLLRLAKKVLVLGDPAQLPPVAGGGFFTENVKPDVMLTDIHRQAQDNPIIALATRVRQQQGLSLGTYGDSRVVTGRDIVPEDALEADQILVGRNKTRHASNRRFRALHERKDPYPVAGDKLVCLRNNHEKGLLNGALWTVSDVGRRTGDVMYMTVISEDGQPLEVDAHTHHFEERELPWFERKNAEEFDYGYALTVHKSQGSQWDDVLLFNESGSFREHAHRWLYTGITRAAERITVVQM